MLSIELQLQIICNRFLPLASPPSSFVKIKRANHIISEHLIISMVFKTGALVKRTFKISLNKIIYQQAYLICHFLLKNIKKESPKTL